MTVFSRLGTTLTLSLAGRGREPAPTVIPEAQRAPVAFATKHGETHYPLAISHRNAYAAVLYWVAQRVKQLGAFRGGQGGCLFMGLLRISEVEQMNFVMHPSRNESTPLAA